MILPSAVQCAGRTTPTRSVELERAGPAGAGDHDAPHRPCAPQNGRFRRSPATDLPAPGVARLTISISSSALAASANSGRPTR